tara:strand:+ start:201 stop:1502 length:1302 start_codon:yes stop_codon:yes gene_type:complete
MASNPLGPGDSRLTKVVIKSSLITSTIPYRTTDDWTIGNLAFIEAHKDGGNHINPTEYPDGYDSTSNNYKGPVIFSNGFSIEITDGNNPGNQNWGHIGNALLNSRLNDDDTSKQLRNSGSAYGASESFAVGLYRGNEVTITLPAGGKHIHALVYKPWTGHYNYIHRNYHMDFELYFDNESTPSTTYEFTTPVGANGSSDQNTNSDVFRMLVLSNGQLDSTTLANVTNNYYNNSNTQQAITNKVEVTNITTLTQRPHITLSINCFLKGTMIETMKGILPVEDLRPNMFVKTYHHNYVPIKLIGKMTMPHNSKDKRNKNQLFVCKKEVYPEATDDLVITGCHSLLVDRDITDKDEEQRIIDANGDIFLTDNLVRIPAVADLQTIIYPEDGDHEIYHFSLDHHDEEMNYGVYANGILVETCSNRMMKEYSGMTFLE